MIFIINGRVTFPRATRQHFLLHHGFLTMQFPTLAMHGPAPGPKPASPVSPPIV